MIGRLRTHQIRTKRHQIPDIVCLTRPRMSKMLHWNKKWLGGVLDCPQANTLLVTLACLVTIMTCHCVHVSCTYVTSEHRTVSQLSLRLPFPLHVCTGEWASGRCWRAGSREGLLLRQAAWHWGPLPGERGDAWNAAYTEYYVCHSGELGGGGWLKEGWEFEATTRPKSHFGT